MIVHFDQGQPDLGRKTFQPDKTELAIKLSINVVNLLKKYRNHLKSDETSDPLTPDRDKHQWIRAQEDFLDKNPLKVTPYTSSIGVLAKPQQEQDVVALFNQMLGAKLIRGIEIYTTSEHTRYDSLLRLNYADEDIYYSHSNLLGVSENAIVNLPYVSEPKVLEYKYDFDALVRECLSEEKYHNHINLVVAWSASLELNDKVELKSLLIDDRGSFERTIFGSTHVAYLSGTYHKPIYEVIILEDLMNYLADPEAEVYRQKDKYKEA